MKNNFCDIAIELQNTSRYDVDLIFHLIDEQGAVIHRTEYGKALYSLFIKIKEGRYCIKVYEKDSQQLIDTSIMHVVCQK